MVLTHDIAAEYVSAWPVSMLMLEKEIAPVAGNVIFYCPEI